MVTLLIGTEKGLFEIKDAGEPRPLLESRQIGAFARADRTIWAIADETSLVRDGEEVTVIPHEGASLLASNGNVFVGTEEAHLYRLRRDSLELIEAFEEVPTRAKWYTPWGGPPAVRSLAASGKAIFANVHVGGVLRSRDAGKTWDQTPLDIDSDIHEVIATGRRVLCAGAVGLCDSRDGGETWEVHTDGLHAEYCRALAVSGKTLYLSASQSHTGRQAALYRAPLDLSKPFDRCREGLPEWFDDNIDSGCIAASGATVAIGTTDGSVFVSTDRGAGWREIASSLPAITQVGLA
jgi:outer membrane protein assembly factor BamB